MACLLSGAKQIASMAPASVASMHWSSTCSTERPPGASARLRCTSAAAMLSTARKAGRAVPALPRTSASVATSSVPTSVPAMRWPSCHSQRSPTSTILAMAAASGLASSLAISSAPMPAGSPSVTATTGFVEGIMVSVQFDVVHAEEVAAPGTAIRWGCCRGRGHGQEAIVAALVAGRWQAGRNRTRGRAISAFINVSSFYLWVWKLRRLNA